MASGPLRFLTPETQLYESLDSPSHYHSGVERVSFLLRNLPLAAWVHGEASVRERRRVVMTSSSLIETPRRLARRWDPSGPARHAARIKLMTARRADMGSPHDDVTRLLRVVGYRHTPIWEARPPRLHLGDVPQTQPRCPHCGAP